MSADSRRAEMTEEQMSQFLARQGHGVLSFGGDRPYSLPLSFGYDSADGRCIFQFVFDGQSTKRARSTDAAPVSLVAYDWHSPDDWRSVVAAGRLRPIDDDSPEAIAAADVFAEHASAIGLSVFSKSFDDLDTQWSALDIEELSGYCSP
ncbi:hypothetical protein SAMN04488065_2854 [Haloplanus vescus]|uniref:Pyridoxamine 5'-phosphate oxidase n=1 Tax=Haloplanus vescus TaxID=555874 RepID=A0A1H4ALB6_9EURY|nr:pyridoxamine 5'-phosphate oxidase family protein [Haloplanus vescus]SEA36710.1 hypothetical protein SAMN04488065_2854 [Haloplanus vescus]